MSLDEYSADTSNMVDPLETMEDDWKGEIFFWFNKIYVAGNWECAALCANLP